MQTNRTDDTQNEKSTLDDKVDLACDAFSTVGLDPIGGATELVCNGLAATGEVVGDVLSTSGEALLSVAEALGNISN